MFSFLDSIETIGDSAFSGTGISKIEFGKNSVIRYETSSFDGMESLQKFSFSPKSSSIPSRMFSGCKSLAEIIFPKNSMINSIPDFAFANVINLEYINLSPCIRTIGNNAFFGLSKLYKIVGLERVVEIGSNSFSGTVIEEAHLESIESLSESSFERCLYLRKVNFTATPTPLSRIASKLYLKNVLQVADLSAILI